MDVNNLSIFASTLLQQRNAMQAINFWVAGWLCLVSENDVF